jgi:hypothetical protein
VLPSATTLRLDSGTWDLGSPINPALMCAACHAHPQTSAHPVPPGLLTPPIWAANCVMGLDPLQPHYPC